MAENQSKTQLHDRIKTLRDALSNGLYEKDDAVRLALLTAIAGESIFFLGAPGCAKSMIARRIVKAFKADGNNGIKYFETLLNQFSTPEDVFGNISLKALNGELPDCKGKEEYRRLTENMLPEADIAFLDEIWKASPAILNTLLTIINERKFHNGSKVMDVPLKGLLAASNELPAKDRGLEALYDRFIIRLGMDYIQNEDNFFEMIEEPSSLDFELTEEVKKLQITNDELKSWKEKIDAVTLSEEAKEVISAIRKELSVRNEKLIEENKDSMDPSWQSELFEVSDRRWKKIIHLLKTSAFLNDRDSIDLMDCSLIEYCIWNTENQHKQAREIVENCIKENGLECDTAIEDIEDQIDLFDKYVTDQFFIPVNKPLQYKMNDAKMAYKIKNPIDVYFADQHPKPYYITENFVWSGYNDRKGMLYDANRDKLGINYNFSFSDFKLSDGKVTWTDWWRNYKHYSEAKYSMEIETTPGSEFEPKKFSDIAHETLQKNFDKEHYTPIVSRIHSEIASLKAKREKDAVPFKANLFANQEYTTSILTKIDESIHQLQDTEVTLEKQHNRYFKKDLAAAFSVGDVLLNNGTVFSFDEIKSLNEEQKKQIIGVLCIGGKEPHAISLEEYDSVEWNNLGNLAKNSGKNLPEEYASKWSVPGKSLLNTIWENRETINKTLKEIGSESILLSAKEYWTSTESGSSAAFYQLFDERGHQDHTTKDHQYAVRLIISWKK